MRSVSMMTETALDLIEQADRCNPGAREVHIQKVLRPFCQGLGERHLLLLLRVAMFGLITDDGPHAAVFKAIDEAIAAIRERGVMPLISIAGLHPPSRDAAVGHPVGYWSIPSVEAPEPPMGQTFDRPLDPTKGHEDPRDVNWYASMVDRDTAHRYRPFSTFDRPLELSPDRIITQGDKRKIERMLGTSPPDECDGTVNVESDRGKLAYRQQSTQMFGVNGREPMETMTPDTSPPIGTSDPSGEES